jgi:FO synthase
MPARRRRNVPAGANDLGGTLMNESITRAAGALHGKETPPEMMEEIISALGRRARQRTTLYGDAPAERVAASFGARPLLPTTTNVAPEFADCT